MRSKRKKSRYFKLLIFYETVKIVHRGKFEDADVSDCSSALRLGLVPSDEGLQPETSPSSNFPRCTT